MSRWLPDKLSEIRGEDWKIRMAVLMASAVLAGSVGLFYRPAYQLTAWLVLPTDPRQVWDESMAVAEREPQVRVKAEPSLGFLAMSVTTSDGSRGRELLDGLGEKVVAIARAALAAQAASQPVRSAEYAALAQALAPDSSVCNLLDASLLLSDEQRHKWRETWDRLQSDRERIAAALAETNERLTGATRLPGAAGVDERRMAEMEKNDQRLTTDLEEQRGLRQALADALLQLMLAGQARLQKYTQSVAESRQVLTQEMQADHGEQIQGFLQAMQTALSEGSAAAESLIQSLDENITALSEKGAALDPTELLSKLGPAVRPFIDRSSVAQQRVDQALESIKTSADYLPARLAVLYNKLTRQMRGTQGARSTAVEAAQALYLAQNVALAQQVNRITQLTSRIDDRRAEIRRGLREGAQADLEARHKAAMGQAEAERSRLQREWSERQQRLLDMAEKVMQELTADTARDEMQKLAKLIDWHRRNREDFARLLAMDEAREKALNDRPGPAAVCYIPPDAAGSVRMTGNRWLWVVLAGAVPLLIYMIGGLLITARRCFKRQPTFHDLAFSDLESLSDKEQEPPGANEILNSSSEPLDVD